MNKAMMTLVIGLSTFVVAAGVLGYLSWTELDAQAALEEEIKKLEPVIARHMAKIRNRDKIQKELDEIRSHFTNFVSILPSLRPGTDVELQTMTTRFLSQSGCVSSRFEPIVGKPDEIGKGSQDFARRIVRLRMEGTFDQVRSFMDVVERDPQLLRIDSFSMQPKGAARGVASEGATMLDVQLEFSVYYFSKPVGQPRTQAPARGRQPARAPARR